MAKAITFKKSIPAYMLILPAFILLLVFHYLPIFGITMAFQDYSVYKGIFGSKLIGFTNFQTFLRDANFWRVMRNTVLLNLYELAWGFPVPIIFALMLNELRSDKFKKIAQTISYLPHFISWVVVCGIVVAVLSPESGLLNLIIKNVFGMEPIHFLAKPKYFRSIIVIATIWKNFGMGAVYYISALSSIDQELYASAAIDGAGRLRQTWHITLPGLRVMIIVLLVMNMGGMINIGFEKIFLLYNPLLYDVGDVLSTYTYRLGIQNTRYSLTSAIGLSESVVNFLLVMFSNKIAKKVAGWSLW